MAIGKTNAIIGSAEVAKISGTFNYNYYNGYATQLEIPKAIPKEPVGIFLNCTGYNSAISSTQNGTFRRYIGSEKCAMTVTVAMTYNGMVNEYSTYTTSTNFSQTYSYNSSTQYVTVIPPYSGVGILGGSYEYVLTYLK